MNLYTFFREDGFYPLELESDAVAKSNAAVNPGTMKVENMTTGEIVWGVEYCPECDVIGRAACSHHGIQ